MEENDIIQEAKNRSADMILALTPILDQLAVLRLKREMLPKLDVTPQIEELKEIEQYYLDLICQITGIKQTDTRKYGRDI